MNIYKKRWLSDDRNDWLWEFVCWVPDNERLGFVERLLLAAGFEIKAQLVDELLAAGFEKAQLVDARHGTLIT